MDERTAEDYVKDMLDHKRDWIAIMAVARAIRNGKWYDECKEILQTKGLMPKSEAEIHKQQVASIKAPIVINLYQKQKNKK